MASRSALPHWPRLMCAEMAAQYLSVGVTTFKGLDIKARRLGRRVLWHRDDLDRFVDRLDGQPLDPREEQREAAEVERGFLEKRRGKN